MYNDTIQYEGFWGICDSPCQAHLFFPSPMIGTDGGDIKLRFLSDNVMNFKGWWIEYQLGELSFNHFFLFTLYIFMLCYIKF